MLRYDCAVSKYSVHCAFPGDFVSPGFYAWATLAVFSVLLLVDFMRLRDGGMGLNPVQLSLSIYLDALNIFIALLQIFGMSGGGRRDSRWS